jgi:hypothetical protein
LSLCSIMGSSWVSCSNSTPRNWTSRC